MRQSILSYRFADLVLILFPGLLALAFFYCYPFESMASLTAAFFLVSLIDSGHVYTTFLRTYFNASEMRRSRVHIWTPLAVFSLVYAWEFFSIPFLTSFLLYATVYHHVRQHYGVFRWYEKITKVRHAHSHRFLYALMICPLIAFHFRGNLETDIFLEQSMIRFPSETLYLLFTAITAVLLIAWLAYELSFIRKGTFNLMRFFSLACPILLYVISLSFLSSVLMIIFAFVISHGVPYMALITKSLLKVQPNRYKNVVIATIVVVLFGFTFGGIEVYFEQAFQAGEENKQIPYWIEALYLTPLLTHYYIDSVIWVKQHPESELIY